MAKETLNLTFPLHKELPMRNLIFAINITTDGYCGHTDGIADDELHAFYTNLMRDAGLLLIGRVTYELMVPYWPNVARDPAETGATKEFALMFDSLDKVVFSRTLKQVEGANTRIVATDIVQEVLTLKQQPGKDIFVSGLSIASQLSERGLIDEYHFVVHPVIAGKGPRLFDTVQLKERLKLDFVGLKTLHSGVVALHYKKHK
jgi:dihydrofolate reductase